VNTAFVFFGQGVERECSRLSWMPAFWKFDYDESLNVDLVFDFSLLEVMHLW
jgi:hypothetical protein